VRPNAGLNKKTNTHCSALGRNGWQIIDMYITFLNYFWGSSTSWTGSLIELRGACTHSHRTTSKNSVLFTFSSSLPKIIWILIIFFYLYGICSKNSFLDSRTPCQLLVLLSYYFCLFSVMAPSHSSLAEILPANHYVICIFGPVAKRHGHPTIHIGMVGLRLRPALQRSQVRLFL
jgi:hypothetical protein